MGNFCIALAQPNEIIIFVGQERLTTDNFTLFNLMVPILWGLLGLNKMMHEQFLA